MIHKLKQLKKQIQFCPKKFIRVHYDKQNVKRITSCNDEFSFMLEKKMKNGQLQDRINVPWGKSLTTPNLPIFGIHNSQNIKTKYAKMQMSRVNGFSTLSLENSKFTSKSLKPCLENSKSLSFLHYSTKTADWKDNPFRMNEWMHASSKHRVHLNKKIKTTWKSKFEKKVTRIKMKVLCIIVLHNDTIYIYIFFAFWFG